MRDASNHDGVAESLPTQQLGGESLIHHARVAGIAGATLVALMCGIALAGPLAVLYFGLGIVAFVVAESR